MPSVNIPTLKASIFYVASKAASNVYEILLPFRDWEAEQLTVLKATVSYTKIAKNICWCCICLAFVWFVSCSIVYFVWQYLPKGFVCGAPDYFLRIPSLYCGCAFNEQCIFPSVCCYFLLVYFITFLECEALFALFLRDWQERPNSRYIHIFY